MVRICSTNILPRKKLPTTIESESILFWQIGLFLTAGTRHGQGLWPAAGSSRPPAWCSCHRGRWRWCGRPPGCDPGSAALRPPGRTPPAGGSPAAWPGTLRRCSPGSPGSCSRPQTACPPAPWRAGSIRTARPRRCGSKAFDQRCCRLSGALGRRSGQRCF